MQSFTDQKLRTEAMLIYYIFINDISNLLAN